MNKVSWNKIQAQSSMKPNARWGQSSCLIDEELVIFAGYADNTYMNDIWVLNLVTFKWDQLKPFGDIPECRSNATMNYDKINNRILMFGGGGNNKKRFNSVYSLDWQTKQWKQLQVTENIQNAPWQRTYHCSQLIGKYLVIFGGQNFADLDDLWAFDTEKKIWKQIKNFQTMIKPCARRFHTSILKGTKMYIIAGCKEKYRCLSDLYEIDLKCLINENEEESFEWKKVQIQGSNIITRWGHSSTYNSNSNKIYIFGGRFSEDLNDLLSIDLQKKIVEQVKIQKDLIPNARRRHSAQLIGNHLIIFGGFNGSYFNDLHSIKVEKNISGLDNLKQQFLVIDALTEKDQKSLFLVTKNNQQYSLNSIILQYFESQAKFQLFKQFFDNNCTKQELQKILISIVKGFNVLYFKKGQTMNQTQNQLVQKMKNFVDVINSKKITKNKIYYTKDEKQLEAQNRIKDIMNNQRLSNENYKPFSKKNGHATNKLSLQQQNCEFMVLNENQYEQFTDLFRLREGIQLLDNVISNQQKQKQEFINKNYEYYMFIQNNYIKTSRKFMLFSHFFKKQFQFDKNFVYQGKNNIQEVQFYSQIALNFLKTSIIVHPQNFGAQQFIKLYQTADYFLIDELKSKLQKRISQILNQQNLSVIAFFASESKLETLMAKCCQYLIKTSMSFKNIQNAILKNEDNKKLSLEGKMKRIQTKVLESAKAYKFSEKSQKALHKYFQVSKYDFSQMFIQQACKQLIKKKSKNSQNQQKQNQQNNPYYIQQY